MAKRSKNHWDDIFVQQKVFNRLAHLAPAVIVYSSLQYIFDADTVVTFLGNLAQSSMVVIVLMVIDSVLNALLEIYNNLPISRGRNIKGYVQVVKIIFTFAAVIMIISIFTGDPPAKLLTGLDAMAAVLMLVFRDTILGFVASIQLSANRMVNVGDWISMPKYNADGDVIDGSSVTFLKASQIDKFRKYYLLKDYINQKEKAWAKYEGIQADIFDHVLAILPEFDLRVFQNPTGSDFQKLAE